MYPKKSLGQNFLTSTHIVEEMVREGEVAQEDTVLEIGPGKGILTTALLKSGACVIAVEKDDSLIPVLEEKFEKEIKNKKLTLIHGDILEINIEKVLPKKYRLVANIPYYITGQIIRNFLESDRQPASMTLLVQKEVAERILARDSKESLLSLSVKVFGKVKIIRTVSKGAFNPVPKVDSAIIHITNISLENFKTISKKNFFNLIHLGFAHKRKQLMPNLEGKAVGEYSKDALMSAFEVCEISLKVRAEDVSLPEWIHLCKVLHS